MSYNKKELTELSGKVLKDLTGLINAISDIPSESQDTNTFTLDDGTEVTLNFDSITRTTITLRTGSSKYTIIEDENDTAGAEKRIEDMVKKAIEKHFS